MIPNTHKAIVSVLLAGLFMAGQQVFTASAQAYDMSAQSAVWIEGTSTVNSFVCSTDDVSGSGQLLTASREPHESGPGQSGTAGDSRESLESASGSEVAVHVPVRQLDCGLPAMNRDLRESLKADRQPTIDFRLDHTEVLATPEQNDGLYLLRAHGWLSLAGSEQKVSVILEGERTEDGRLRGWGSKDLRMSEFGIKPPSALFGLVRAHDDITVRFNFVAEPKSTARE
jgi:hypothetical protein